MITKTEIKDYLKDLEKIGWLVMTANSNHPMPSGLVGLTDHIMIHKQKGIIFIECKIGKDELRPKQIIFKSFIIAIRKLTKYIQYIEITDKNYMEVIETIAHL